MSRLIRYREFRCVRSFQRLLHFSFAHFCYLPASISLIGFGSADVNMLPLFTCRTSARRCIESELSGSEFVCSSSSISFCRLHAVAVSSERHASMWRQVQEAREVLCYQLGLLSLSLSRVQRLLLVSFSVRQSPLYRHVKASSFSCPHFCFEARALCSDDNETSRHQIGCVHSMRAWC